MEEKFQYVYISAAPISVYLFMIQSISSHRM